MDPRLEPVDKIIAGMDNPDDEAIVASELANQLTTFDPDNYEAPDLYWLAALCVLRASQMDEQEYT